MIAGRVSGWFSCDKGSRGGQPAGETGGEEEGRERKVARREAGSEEEGRWVVLLSRVSRKSEYADVKIR